MEVLYKITNKINNKYYIGSSSNIGKRTQSHLEVYACTILQHNELHEDIKQLGNENFRIDVLYESDDKVFISRMESIMIRNHADDEYCYNISYGASGRRVFYEEDIIFIRDLYSQKNLYIQEAYDKFYNNVVTFRAFKKVWHGETFKNIKYDVYTEENKKWHFSKGQSRPGEINGASKFTANEVREIRNRRDNGESLRDVYQEYRGFVSYNSLSDIWKNKTWSYIQ